MLVIMGERWEPIVTWHKTDFRGSCIFVSGVVTAEDNCSIVSDILMGRYRRVYVIGEKVAITAGGDATSGVNYVIATDYVERFTIPIPNVEPKEMTAEEARKLNGDLKSGWR